MEMLKRYKKRRREVRTARVCTEGYGEMRSVKQRYRQRGEILGVEVRQGGVWRAAEWYDSALDQQFITARQCELR